MSRRPSLHNPFQAPIVADIYSDSRSHGPQGPVRHVRIPQITSQGGGAIAKCEDGLRCVVAGKDSLRILRVAEPGLAHTADHKSAVGRGGYRVDASRNFWTGSGLKIDSASTDVVWGHGNFSNKILTSARNGELIMWDLNKSGPTKYERRVRQHVRSIHKIAYSTVLRDYCITGSADGDIRVWDLRNLTDCIMKIRHPAAVRSVVFSPVQWQPRHAITGLDNGNIYRWDLNMGQRGQLDRIPLAHSGPILALDWTLPPTFSSSLGRNSSASGSGQGGNWYSNMGSGLFDDLNGLGSASVPSDADGTGMGWLASGGLDRCVKVWDMTPPAGEAHVCRNPIYTMHTSSPVRRVAWRTGYECELAVTSSFDASAGAQASQSFETSGSSLGLISSSPQISYGHLTSKEETSNDGKPLQNGDSVGNPIEIWDVRRGYVAKWTVRGSAVEGGVTDIAFSNSHTLWAQHFSGTFSQLDLRYSMRTLDAIPRASATWDPTGILVFVTDRPKRWEIPYDDVQPDKRLPNKRKLKALGSKPYSPVSQTIGILSGHGLMDDAEQFAKLAQDYVYQGSDRITVCSRNAEVAFEVGKHDAAQTWLLLASLLSDTSNTNVDTPAITLSPLPLLHPRLPQSSSAPTSIPSVQATMPPTPSRSQSEVARTPATEFASPASMSGSVSGSLPRRHTTKSRTQSTSSAGTGFLSPLRTTPASSTTPSPHRSSTPLPPMAASLSPAILVRRKSGAGLPMSLGTPPPPPPPARARLGSSYRRPSFKAPSMHSVLTEGDSRSHSNLKLVGEGAIDSDSDGSGSDEGDPRIESAAVSDTESAALKDDDGEHLPRTDRARPTPSPASSSGSASHWHSRASSVQPSPLSKVAVPETWTEDEKDEDDSPSPASTDSETSSGELEGLSSPGFRPPHPLTTRQYSSRSRRSSVRSSRTKSRSRSSTVASLSVSLPLSASGSRARLSRRESQSSLRTVTAVATPTSMQGQERAQDDLHRDAAARDPSGPATYTGGRSDAVSLRSLSYHPRSRPRSELFSNEEDDDPGTSYVASRRTVDTPAPSASRNAAFEAISQAEARLREVAWQAMTETLDILVDDGDIQMCAMLALVAPKELKISNGRVLRFIESYIDLLSRMRLHSAAAYIRKYAPRDEVRSKTEVGTTLETMCGRCRKPLLQTATKPTVAGKPSGGSGFCSRCKASTAKCAICHLPVRMLAFTCPLCMHGGHQECYQQYLLRRPLLTISCAPSPPAATAEPLPAVPFSSSTQHFRTSDSRGRGRTPSMSRSRDGDTSDDGTSARETEEGSVTKTAERSDREVGVSVAIQGHPCAAGCGHFCWATNDASAVASILA